MKRTGVCSVTYSDVKGGWIGEGNIDADPIFVTGPMGDYYLSHTAAGQPADSPCIDTGSDLAVNICVTPVTGDICLDEFTTRTDLVTDSDTVDMGFHYAPVTPTETPTSTPTMTPTGTPTLEPTATPTATAACEETGVLLWMPAQEYYPGDPCSCFVTVCNLTGSDLVSYPLFVILDVYGMLFFAPGFTEDVDHYLDDYPVFPIGETLVEVIPEFTWPDSAGSASGIYWYSALTNPEMTEIFGAWDAWEFGWSEINNQRLQKKGELIRK